MSKELFRARCRQGHLVIYDDKIAIELKGLGSKSIIKSESLMRDEITGIDTKLFSPSVFGIGGGQNLIFHSRGSQTITAGAVKSKDAKKVQELLA